jgi:hypothetical protein
MRGICRTGFAALAATVLAANAAVGQGAGTTALEVAQIPAGARAGALGGAYTGVWNDADAVFYNPASVAGLDRAVSLSYQRHVLDISFGSVAGGIRLGRLAVGAGIAFMDGGEVPEIVPDDAFGGQRGRATGQSVSARESTARFAVGAPLMDGRLHVGGAVGVALSELAGVSRSAALLDAGAQASVFRHGTVGLSLRNIGGALGGSGAQDADLPSEARVGATYRFAAPAGFGSLPPDLGLLLAADAIRRIAEEANAFAGGVEIGLMPGAAEAVTAVARVGYRAEDGLGSRNALQIGAGIGYASVFLDYQFQDVEFFGTAHRIGVRWRPTGR